MKSRVEEVDSQHNSSIINAADELFVLELLSKRGYDCQGHGRIQKRKQLCDMIQTQGSENINFGIFPGPQNEGHKFHNDDGAVLLIRQICNCMLHRLKTNNQYPSK